MNKFMDIADKKYGKLTAIKYVDTVKGQRRWLCRCDCGNEIMVQANMLNARQKKSCGCDKHVNLVGERYGKLTVLKLSEINKRHNLVWLCKCDCGGYTEVPTNKLKSGWTSSCGCLNQNRNRKIINIESALYSYNYLKEYEPVKAANIIEVLRALTEIEQQFIIMKYFERMNTVEVLSILGIGSGVYVRFRLEVVNKFKEVVCNTFS